MNEQAPSMKSKNIWLVVVGIVVLVGLFYILKPKTPTIPATTITPSPTTESTSSAQVNPQSKIFDLVVKNKKLVSGQEVIQVTEGDQITINITSDENEELHIHGYDESVDLEANKMAQLSFTANLTGRFPYELENSKTEIGALEVQPK